MPLPAAHLPCHDYKAKFQYWLVYEDVGKPLDKAPNLKSFFKGIHDACISASCGCLMTSGAYCLVALTLMLLAKWVHRDISVGNVIFGER